MQSFSIVSSHQLLASERSTMPSLQEVAANRRDVEQCKIAFVGIISQILYAKHGFPSTCFQLVKSDHCHKSLQDVFSKSRGIAHFRSKYLEDSRVNVFLRRSSNPGVTKFLRILETDILPLIGTDDLAEFRLTFEESQGQGSTGLKEYFNVICKDFPNGKVDFDVWRAATGHRNLNVTGSGLLGLGVYLSRLNEWKAPARWSMSMRPKVRLDALAGLWIYDVTKPENSNTSLSQQKHYGLERAAHVKVKQLPRKDSVVPLFSRSRYSHAPLSDISCDLAAINNPEPTPELNPVEDRSRTRGPVAIRQTQPDRDSETAQVPAPKNPSEPGLDAQTANDKGTESICDLDGDNRSENNTSPKHLPDRGPATDQEVTSLGSALKRTSIGEYDKGVESQVNKRQKLTSGPRSGATSQARTNSKEQRDTQTNTIAFRTRTVTRKVKDTIPAAKIGELSQSNSRAKLKSKRGQSIMQTGKAPRPITNSGKKDGSRNKTPLLPTRRQLPSQPVAANMDKTVGIKASQKPEPAKRINVGVAKRKPKRPAKILEDAAFLQPEKSGKKREEPTGVVSSDSSANPGAASQDDLPQLPPTQDSSPLHRFAVSGVSSNPLQASPPDANIVHAHNEGADETAWQAGEERDAIEFSQATRFPFSPNTVRRRVALNGGHSTSDSDWAESEP